MRAGQQITAVEYLEALQMRDRVKADLAATLAGVDALILPTTAVTAPPRGQTDVAVTGGTMSVREAVLGQTLPFSLCGLPALSVPSGFSEGLPLSLSLVGASGADAATLGLGRWLEGRLDAMAKS